MSPETLSATAGAAALRNDAPPALHIEHLSVSYGGMRALSDVSITVPAGKSVALLGPNGAGKSTTLRAISGLVRNETGRIHIHGERSDRKSPHTVARMGVVHVPEGRGVFPSLTVQENLEMSSYAVGREVDPVSEGTALFPALAPRLKQLAGSLSGGEQQMLSLARALLSKPKLLMVDEISMGLAPIIVQQLFEALGERADAGTSLLLVEQYIDAALNLADYVYVLEKGRVVDVGEPDDVRRGGLISAYLGS
ncbi:MAG: ABC transporter ATP-binding protein [Acidimicrobiales bacterium]